jgi:REP element-mobilizing transposase RayT
VAYDPNKHHRRSIRLKGHDYSAAGIYFITLCTQHREPLFGAIVDGTMQLNEFGQIVAKHWQWLATQYPYVKLDEWVVMPNHFHGILILTNASHRRGGSRTAPTTTTPTNDATPPPTHDATPPASTNVATPPASTNVATQPTSINNTTPPISTHIIIPPPYHHPNLPITSTNAPKRKPLGRLIGAFKTISTKEINQIRNTPSIPLWQRNYYEIIIRNPIAYQRIRRYIQNNPQSWNTDNLHPNTPPNT